MSYIEPHLIHPYADLLHALLEAAAHDCRHWDYAIRQNAIDWFECEDRRPPKKAGYITFRWALDQLDCFGKLGKLNASNIRSHVATLKPLKKPKKRKSRRIDKKETAAYPTSKENSCTTQP